MKTKIILLGVLVVYSIHAQSGPIYKQFGNMIIDVNKPNKLSYLNGKINSVRDGIVTLDIYKSTYHVLPAQGNAGIGAYSASSSGYSVKEFDRTVALTNFPNINDATVDQQIRIKALRMGTFKVSDSSPIEFYDCGTPYVPPPPTPEQIKAAQDAAKAKAIADKKRADQGQINAVRWLQPQATNGDASAQCSLGLHYLNGQGCETNREQAIYWLKKAADQGDAEATTTLTRLQK